MVSAHGPSSVHRHIQLWHMLCRSLVTKTDELFDPEDVTSPVSQRCADPSLFSGILSDTQINLCQSDAKLLSTTAIGVLRALNECQKLFKNRLWNCSVFDAGPYLGKFIEQGTFLTLCCIQKYLIGLCM